MLYSDDQVQILAGSFYLKYFLLELGDTIYISRLFKKEYKELYSIFFMTLKSIQKKEWEKVYSENQYSDLPWFGLKPPKQLREFVKQLPKSELVLITGCGVGDIVNYVYGLGFHNILGTDISSEAIKIARLRFPKLRFEVKKTEELPKDCKNKANTIDLYVVHHIEPNDLEKYVSALEVISKNLLVCFFYDERQPLASVSSVKKKQSLYNYNPDFVASLFKTMKRSKEDFYDLETKLKSGKKLKFRVVAQSYFTP